MTEEDEKNLLKVLEDRIMPYISSNKENGINSNSPTNPPLSTSTSSSSSITSPTTSTNSTIPDQFSPQGKCLYIKLLQNLYLKELYKIRDDINNVYIKHKEKEIEAKKKHMPLPSLTSNDILILKNLKKNKKLLIKKSKQILYYGLIISNEGLEINDPLTLSLVIQYCEILLLVNTNKSISHAKTLSQSAFNQGASITHTLSPTSLELLQQLRDKYMMLEVEEPETNNNIMSNNNVKTINQLKLKRNELNNKKENEEKNDKKDEDDSSDDDNYNDSDDESSINNILLLFSNDLNFKKRSKKSQEILNIRNQKYLEYNTLLSAPTTLSTYYVELIKKIKQQLHFELYPNLMYNSSNKKGYNLVTLSSIQAANAVATSSDDSSSTHIPLLLENLSISSSILSTLHTIFKVYLKGNALTGQMKPMNRVSIGDKEINLSDFLLQGPFLSLKGFLRFIFDFKISFLPLNKVTKSNFIKIFPELLPNVGSSSDDESASTLLHLEEVLIMFQESSRSLLPLLVTKKNLQVYREKVNNYEKLLSSVSSGMAASSSSALSSTLSSSASSSSLSASLATVSPSHLEGWSSVFSWADSIDSLQNNPNILNEWSTSNGLNFMQFVDCVAKLGALAYSSPYFNDILPLLKDKVMHFFTATLGLIEENKWRPKVDSIVRKAKETMQKIKERK